MKVAQIVLNLKCGGLEKLVIQLSEELNRQGIKTFIICLEERGELAAEAEKKGIKVLCLDKQKGFNFKWVVALKKLIKEEKCDLVHTHNFAPLIYGTLASALAFKPCVNTRHSRTPVNVSWLIWNLNKFIIFVSKDTQKEIINYNRIFKHKQKVIYNGIKIEDFNPQLNPLFLNETRKKLGIDENSFVIGNVGRLVEDKDQETLLKAYRKLCRKEFKGDLVIVGDGHLKDFLNKRAGDFGIRDRVKFLGFRDDVAQIMQVFDVYVLSSIREGVSLTLLEAMAAGKPIVATKIGGNPEVVIEGETGYLVPCGFPERLETAIMRLAINKNLKLKMGESARKRVEDHFSIKKMSDEYIGLYKAALGKK